MMKRLALIFSFLIGCLPLLKGQQAPHYTQYMFNEFVINPAITGIHDYYQIRSNHRFQWIGVSDAPITNTLSFYGPHKSMPMGFGGYMYSDVTGPTSRSGINGSYAYNLAVNDDIRISMGLSLGIMQFKIDGTQIQVKDNSDVALQDAIYSAYVPDGSVGVYVYDDEFYAGFSTAQLFNNKLKLYEQKSGLNKLKSHFYLTGGYKYRLNSDFLIEPSLIMKGSAPVTIQFDINTRVVWRDMAWGGLSFRSKDALSILLGYIHEENIYFGYSYDFTITDLRKYNSGTHEIMIGYKFQELR